MLRSPFSGIYWFDFEQGKTGKLVYDDPELVDFCPVPVMARPLPPVIPDHTIAGQETGTMFCMDVYRTNPRDNIPFQRGQVKKVRFLTGFGPMPVREWVSDGDVDMVAGFLSELKANPGIVGEFLVAGPFKSQAGPHDPQRHYQEFPPEGVLKGEKFEGKRVTPSGRFPVIDTKGVTYVYAEIEVTEEQDAHLRLLGCTAWRHKKPHNMFVLWVSGEKVWDRDRPDPSMDFLDPTANMYRYSWSHMHRTGIHRRKGKNQIFSRLRMRCAFRCA